LNPAKLNEFFDICKKVDRSVPNQCLYVDPSGTPCGAPAINSHSLQRLGPLAAISEDGHVTNGEVFGIRHLHLICYRALCLEYTKKQRQIALMNELRTLDRVKEDREFLNHVVWTLEGSRKGMADLLAPKARLEAPISGEDDRGFYGVLVEFSQILPFAYTGGFAPEYSFTGRKCMEGDPLSYDWDIVCAFCGKFGERTLFAMGGFQTHSRHLVRTFIDSFRYHSTGLRSAYVLNFALSHIENTFFRPSWYDRLTDQQRKFIVRKCFDGVGPVPYDQYTLIPDVKINTGDAIRTEFFL
jgi:hypothetical protein